MPSDLGPNAWVIDEMAARFETDPTSLPDDWREYFENGHRPPPESGPESAPATAKPGAAEHDAGVAETAAESADEADGVEFLRGAAKLIAENMETSLSVPTATSVRTVTAKVLEENRKLVNDEHARKGASKVSFTHLIAFAIVKALGDVPAMNSLYSELDGKPAVDRDAPVNLGLAVDQKKKSGERTLIVPNIKAAASLDFAGFVAAYEALIARVRTGKLSADDFAGTSITITNPGMIGTQLSVPRLMSGQAAIIGVGSINYPPGLQDADPDTLARLGVSKVLTLTSTYDHRVIQGAESGEFLGRIEEYLDGEHGFYDDVFRSLGLRSEPIRAHRDISPERRGSKAVHPGEEKAAHVLQLINMYRVRGHLLADLNPLASSILTHPELDPETYELTLWDFDRAFYTDGLGGHDVLTLRQILDRLRAAYCNTVGIEYMYIQDPVQKAWIQARVEGDRPEPSRDAKRRILRMLNRAEGLETFLATKYPGTKRFGLEGCETAIPMLDAVLNRAADNGVKEVVLGMAHRGRINVLANLIGKDFHEIFAEFEGNVDPDTVQGSGDVKYHLGAVGEHETPAGNTLALRLAPNPSHLEAVDPVVEGMTRGLQSAHGRGSHPQIMPVLIHGDAAFAGQGVVAETLNLSQLLGYRTGGTIHLIVNNIIGFTTLPGEARTGHYATDVAKMIQAPVFHVNAEDPEAAIEVMQIAFDFRQEFAKDVVVDMIGFRRFGHNEADEPSFTQPRMYEGIDARSSVREQYTATLAGRGDITHAEAEEARGEFKGVMQEALDATRDSTAAEFVAAEPPPAAGVAPHIDTGVGRPELERIADVVTSVPDGFEIHPKLARLLDARAAQLADDKVDWAMAEQLAFGSLMLEGYSVRLAGQDSGRGTFSHRHSVLVDQATGRHFRPLQHLVDGEPPAFRVYDSSLSEYAALGFEYGYSVMRPDALTLWEAQFGDFANGAQIVIDQYIVAAEDKWDMTSDLVMLLPHGFEGQGPEHSSARLERFLILCAEDNICVAQPTKAAQLFHLLRRQKYLDEPKPLVIFTPKSLLRLGAASSPASAFESGSFEELLTDTTAAEPESIELVLFCTGKIAYDLHARRVADARDDVAILRVEQLYPFPRATIRAELARLSSLGHVRWVQEEPDNMGAWSFVEPRLGPLLPEGVRLSAVTRRGSASPAAGSAAVHRQEQAQLVDAAFAPATSNRLEGPHPRQL